MSMKDMTKTITIDVKDFLEKEEKAYRELATELISKINDRKEDDIVSDIAKGLAYMMDCLRARVHLLGEIGALTSEEVDKVIEYFKDLTIELTERSYEDFLKEVERKHKIDADGFDWELGDYTIHIRAKEN